MTEDTIWTPPDGTVGLTHEEAERRLAQFGPNTLVPSAKRTGLFNWLWRAIADPMVVLLLIAGATYAFIGDVADAVVVVVAVVPVTLVSLILEARSERALAALHALTAPTARVWRDGRAEVLPAGRLVPGDIVHLQEGDVVAADAAIVGGLQLAVDESALTGESQPVDKTPLGSTPDDPVEATTVFGGTTIVSGRGVVRVTATGASTRYGQIGQLVSTIETTRTPIERVINRLMAQLGAAALVACAAVAVIELAGGHGWQAAVIAGVSLAIAAMPEEFPMVYTLYMSLGAWRLARANMLVRRLAGVEALGATTVICADKTGTLTLGRVSVTGVLATEGTGDEKLLAAAVLASEPQPFDLLEQAILDYASAAGVDVAALHRQTMVRDYPFDPQHKYMSHVWRERERTCIAAKGAIEGILHHAHASLAQVAEAMAANDRLAANGMRVLAVAGGEIPADLVGLAGDLRDENGQTWSDRQSVESNLRYLGLVAFADPLRPGVREAIQDCREAGIRVIMITGDHPATAHAIADDLGLPHDEAQALATGADLDEVDEERLAALVGSVNIFARTRPEQKYHIVQALKKLGHVVAMTGDGINDAPALREADIGVAMGQRGTAVAREAATLVLLDDNFATIVHAVEEGRRIFENLRRSFSYLVAFHAPLLFAALLVPLLGAPLLQLPVHLVWLEIIVHPTASLVFEADRAETGVMSRPPRRPDEGLITFVGFMRSLSLGATLSAAVIAVYLTRLQAGALQDEARAMALAVLFVGQVWLVLAERSPERPLWQAAPHPRAPRAKGERTDEGARSESEVRESKARHRTSAVIWLILGATLASLLAALYVPPLASLLRVRPFEPAAWAAIVVIASLATLWQEPLKWWRGRERRREEAVSGG